MGGDDWRHWTHPGLGLEAVANAAPRVVSLLVLGIGPEDDEQLLATIRLARRLATGPLEVIAGRAHPSASWYEAVREAGADRVVLASEPRARSRHDGPSLENAIELGDRLCPEMHVKHEQEVTLSVCGRQRDRLVLARHHLDRWCLAAKEECPRWQGGARG